MKARKRSSGPSFKRRVEELQRTGIKQVQAVWERGLELLPPAPRKVAKRWVADADRARRDLRKRGARVVADLRKATQGFTTEASKQVASAVKPVTERLDVATRADVERLRKRLEHIERRLQSHSSATA